MVEQADERRNLACAAVILNASKPSAAARRAERALERRGIDVRFLTTRSAHEGTRAAERVIESGARTVIVGGGDGTVMSVLEPVVRAGATLALLPLGTANDFARYLGLGTIDAALEALASGVSAQLDVSACEYTGLDGQRTRGLFTNCAGVGVMGRLSELESTRLGTLLKRTLGNAVWPLLVTAATLSVRMARARIVLGSSVLERSIAALEVSKVPHMGGIEVTPDAGSDSGILHVWIGEGERRGQLVRTLAAGLRGRGKLLDSPYVQYVSRDPARNQLGVSHLRELSVDTVPPLPLHLNGDYVGRTPLRVWVREGALRVLVPRHHALAGRRPSAPALSLAAE